MKNFTKYHYLWSFLLPVATIACLALGSWFIYIPLASIPLFPILDVALGRSRAQAEGREAFFKAVLYAHVVLFVITLGLFFFRIGEAPLFSLAWFALILAVGGSGFSSAVAAGHELIHSRGTFSKSLGVFLYTLINYNHFAIEHLVTHHSKVATKQDAATALRGESLFAFYLRTIPGQYFDVVRRSRQSARVRNRFISYTLIEILLWGLILGYFGPAAFLAWLGMAFFSVLGLEYANYIRHWGLERAASEAISPLHSWQSDAIWSRAIFLDLPVHSDHHVSDRSYHELRFYDTNRYLPSGYHATFWIASIPPLWKRLMLAKITSP